MLASDHNLYVFSKHEHGKVCNMLPATLQQLLVLCRKNGMRTKVVALPNQTCRVGIIPTACDVAGHISVLSAYHVSRWLI